VNFYIDQKNKNDAFCFLAYQSLPESGKPGASAAPVYGAGDRRSGNEVGEFP
jgi:hypothetical protein